MRGLSAVLVLVAACGDSGGGAARGDAEGDLPGDVRADAQPASDSSAGEAGQGALAAACADYASAFCGRLEACDPLALHGTMGSVAACQDRLGGVACERRFTSAGTTASPAQIAACAAALRGQSCAQRSGTTPEACRLAGALALDARCVFDNQCQSGRCGRDPAAWCGRCQPMVTAGGACDPSQRPCEAGLLCADAACAGTVQNGRCVGKVSWICTAPVPETGACTTRYQCASAMACIDGRCAPAKRKDQPCTGRLDCAREDGTICAATASGTPACRAVSYAEAGEPCDGVAGTLCRASAVCKGTDALPAAMGVCSAPIPDGQPCTESDACAYPALCIAGRCVTPGEAIGTCQ
jgi:hypothetical protein